MYDHGNRREKKEKRRSRMLCSLLPNLDEFLAEEDASFSDDDVSVSDFDEEAGIGNKDDYIQTEDADALEANNENQNKYELCSGMEFSSDESVHISETEYYDIINRLVSGPQRYSSLILKV
ncbi:hypothetical protein DY000_02009558 [Brassica cretica]|uniref:Uncharacterized protein n=1 Tax=Brassica cretica TaxID=69181 RepID=A0ABQ7C9C0_BRACR|nr:hypothetical protein DY000_02009558 [Brassica cretica]